MVASATMPMEGLWKTGGIFGKRFQSPYLIEHPVFVRILSGLYKRREGEVFQYLYVCVCGKSILCVNIIRRKPDFTS